MQTTVSVFGIYNYDNTIFDDFIEPTIQISEYDNLIDNPPAFDKERFIHNLLFQLANIEVVYPDANVLKKMIGLWSSLNSRNWGLLYTSMFYKYNPIWNKDSTTERILTDKGSVDGKTNINQNVYNDEIESTDEKLSEIITNSETGKSSENMENAINKNANNTISGKRVLEGETNKNESIVINENNSNDGGKGTVESTGHKTTTAGLMHTDDNSELTITENESISVIDSGTIKDNKVYESKEVGIHETTVSHGEEIRTEPGHVVNEIYGDSLGNNTSEISTKSMWPYNSLNESNVEKITTRPADKVTEYKSVGLGDKETHGGTTSTVDQWVGNGHQIFIDDNNTKTLDTVKSTVDSKTGSNINTRGVSENKNETIIFNEDKQETENHFENNKSFTENSNVGKNETSETENTKSENIELSLENQSGEITKSHDGSSREDRNINRGIGRTKNERQSADTLKEETQESEKETTEKLKEQGNIGVATTQSLIEQEREVAMFNIYDFIIQSFKENFCVMVY